MTSDSKEHVAVDAPERAQRREQRGLAANSELFAFRREAFVAERPATSGAIPKEEARAGEKRSVVGDVAPAHEAVEERAREVAVAGELGEHSFEVRLRVRRLGATKLTPERTHVRIEVEPCELRAEREVEPDRDRIAPGVVRKPRLGDVRRVGPPRPIEERRRATDIDGRDSLARRR